MFYREARTILEALAIAYPGVPSNRREVAMVYSNLNVLFTRQDRKDEGVTLARSAVDLFTRLVTDYANIPDLYSNLGVALEQLAVNLQQRGDLVGTSTNSYAAASAFAHAYTLTLEPKGRENFASKVISLLHNLETTGYFHIPAHTKALRDEPAFEGLRNRPGFPQG
jgi:hypothetical protein